MPCLWGVCLSQQPASVCLPLSNSSSFCTLHPGEGRRRRLKTEVGAVAKGQTVSSPPHPCDGDLWQGQRIYNLIHHPSNQNTEEEDRIVEGFPIPTSFQEVRSFPQASRMLMGVKNGILLLPASGQKGLGWRGSQNLCDFLARDWQMCYSFRAPRSCSPLSNRHCEKQGSSFRLYLWIVAPSHPPIRVWCWPNMV